MNRFLKYYICIGLFLIYTKGITQELPPITNYNPVAYQAESQSWSITQTNDKVMFFANNAGLLEFNGSRWNIYKNPNESIMRSVKAVENRVYSGCYMDLGYWDRNKEGSMIYTSLLPKLNEQILPDEEFWAIEKLNKWILFQSYNRILIYDTVDESFNEINSTTIITKMALVNETVFFQKQDQGLYKIEGGVDVLVNDDEVFRKSVIVNILAAEEGLKIVTQNNGLYMLKNNRVSPIYSSDKYSALNPSVYSAIQLNSGDYLYGTISNGLFRFDEDLNISYQIDQTNGLGNNTILSIFQDVDKNIWLAYDNGIGCVNLNSPLRIFRDVQGSLGSVYSSILHNGNLYLGTNQGLFYKPKDQEVPFSFIEGSQGQVWCLFEHDNQLFVGHNVGTFLVKNNKIQSIAQQPGSWIMRTVPNKSNLLLQGNYDGIYVLEKSDNSWRIRNKLDGFNISSRFLEVSENKLFVNHEYKGLFKITFDDELYKAIDVNVDSTKKGNNSGLIAYKNNVLFANKEGIFKYNSSQDRFLQDSLLSSMYAQEDYLSGRLIVDRNNEKLWNFSSASVNFFSSGKISDEPILSKLPLPQSLRNSVSNYENVLKIDAKKYLIGTRFGYIIVDLDRLNIQPFPISIDRLVAHSLKTNTSSNIALDENVEVPYEMHNVTFSYSVPEYNSYLTTEYQYRLIGLYDNWSNWTINSTKSFDNLPNGNYTFEVRAKEGESLTTETASFKFIISRPWYLSNAMIILYLLICVLSSFIVHKIYTTYYRRQREKLLQKAKTDLELKDLENKQQKMKFKNDKLKQDIESKNRELATSTMNLIKKNEFLSSIKNELRKEGNKKPLKDIIKIIDNNLNSTDDWKLFEEAFNNADKGFLKKIKKRHDGLTPNDLRLCAYLRLNLSSKEIAPLLNISPRSVEVKRYRLRKKMNLEHETSLANYIINL